MPTVKYFKGEEKKVVVEKKDFGESIFSDQYAQALRTFDRIQANPMDDVPNLIAFCGDRGEGKTSCMSTVSHIIEHIQEKENSDYVSSLGIDVEAMKKRRYEVLSIIDPAFFDKNHNVLELLLGHLYARFKNQEPPSGGYLSKQEVVKCFHKTKYNLRHLDKSKEEMLDPLEELEVLSAGVNLHKTIEDLFEVYLKYVGKDLIIFSIDDLDLNMTEAYTMCEQIRKYLNNGRCIIFVSVKVEQLIEAIENSIHRDAHYPNYLDTRVMAAKYVTKLIPTSIRVEMPKVYDVCDWGLDIYNSREEGAIIESSRTVKEGIVRLIFNTSRYLFYNSKGSISLIVPNNLRNLFQLLGLLTSMKGYDGENKDVLRTNKHLFKSYFYNIWTQQLPEQLYSRISRIINRENSADLNKFVVSELMNWIGDDVNNSLIEAVGAPGSYRYNISVGDVLMLVSYLEQVTFDEDLIKLLFFIKSFYSMLLYEKYDVVTEGNGQIYPKPQKDGEIYKADSWFSSTNALQQFVSGTYFTYSSKDILAPKDQGAQEQFRDYKVINGEALSALFSSLKAQMPKYKDMDAEKRASFEIDFRLAEFFALTVQTSIYARQVKRFQTVDRTQISPYYLVPFNQYTGAYVFDITAPFYNIINIKYCYERFKDIADIYDFALNHEWSLLRRMMGAAVQKDINEKNIDEAFKVENDFDYSMKRLLSNAVLRNSEVLLAVMEGMKSRRFTIRSSRDNKTMLSEFYTKTIESNMQTYRRHEDDDPYFIRFVFLIPIAEFLAEVPADRFDKVYDYSPQNQDNNGITDNMILEMFPGFFEHYGSAKGSTLIQNMRNKQNDRFVDVPEEKWVEIFNVDQKYRKAEAIQALREVYDLFANLDGIGAGEAKENVVADDDAINIQHGVEVPRVEGPAA